MLVRKKSSLTIQYVTMIKPMIIFKRRTKPRENMPVQGGQKGRMDEDGMKLGMWERCQDGLSQDRMLALCMIP